MLGEKRLPQCLTIWALMLRFGPSKPVTRDSFDELHQWLCDECDFHSSVRKPRPEWLDLTHGDVPGVGHWEIVDPRSRRWSDEFVPPIDELRGGEEYERRRTALMHDAVLAMAEGRLTLRRADAGLLRMWLEEEREEVGRQED
jgi:hypothetical protein